MNKSWTQALAGAQDVADVGVKAANLGALMRAGLRVPQGFVVKTNAFHEFLRPNGLVAPVEAILNEAKHTQDASLAEVEAKLSALLGPATIPLEVDRAISSEYRRMCDDGYEVSVAVRSSGTGEDSQTHSYAGVYATALDIRGETAVIKAVKRCWLTPQRAQHSTLISQSSFR